MKEKILLVDDEPAVVGGYRRSLSSLFEVVTSTDPQQALEIVRRDPNGFPVIVSDYMMPGMDGVTFLREVRRVSPDSVCVMITGNHDLHVAMQAVNEGSVFRFITKPCDADLLRSTLDAALHQHRLVNNERQLLHGTLRGCIEVLVEILGMADPGLFGRLGKVHRKASHLASAMGLESTWEMEVAAMLAPIGLITIPPVVLVQHRRGKTLTSAEQEMLDSVPESGFQLLSRIPRLERVAEIVRYQRRRYDAERVPSGEAIPVESRILKVLLDLLDLEVSGMDTEECHAALVERRDAYDPEILQLVLAGGSEPGDEQGGCALTGSVDVALADLQPGAVLAADVVSTAGDTVARAGQVLSTTSIQWLQSYAATTGVVQPIAIRGSAETVPQDAPRTCAPA